ncbi:hypothetical protein IV02_11065 [Pseudomonas syringae]|uniref:Uncharacterized protein n=2 Tax=Pseudomonas syringae TaxID=317 RepID=A0A085V8F7_PSESX|nr:hypothetical protein IV02_11065 [Pseudomonas syringae]
MDKQGMFERCVALRDSSVLNERQIGWSGRWTLMGDFVVCSQCLVAQPIDMAEQPFSHLPGCVAIQYGLYRWHELQQVLGQLPPQCLENRH